MSALYVALHGRLTGSTSLPGVITATARYRYGRPPAEITSIHMRANTEFLPWHGHPMPDVSLPVALMARCRCGRGMAVMSHMSIVVTPARFTPWHGRRMVSTSFPPDMIQPCRYGGQGTR